MTDSSKGEAAGVPEDDAEPQCFAKKPYKASDDWLRGVAKPYGIGSFHISDMDLTAVVTELIAYRDADRTARSATPAAEWQPIATYPSVPDATFEEDPPMWGPEVMLLLPKSMTHTVSDGKPNPEFEIGPFVLVGHLEASMWLFRDAVDLIAWAESNDAPTLWCPIPPLPMPSALSQPPEPNK